MQPNIDRPPESLLELKCLIAKRDIVFPVRLECVARQILQEPELVAFGSAAMIARECNVSETTVLRLPKHVGLQTFTDLKRLFQNHLRDVNSRGLSAANFRPTRQNTADH